MLPSLDPEETIFSWGGKTRLLLGVSARQVSLQIFNSHRAGHSADLPPSLAAVERFGGVSLGDRATLVRQHSVFGPYLTLAEPNRAAEAQDALFDGRLQRGRMLLGLQTNRLGARHPLKYCQACAEEDRRDLGYSRWLVDHQLPGAWICLVHKTVLVEFGKLSHPWQLPLDVSEPVGMIAHGADVHQALVIAAEVVAALVRLEVASPLRLRQAALARMVNLGIVSNPARLNALSIQSAFNRSAIARFAAMRAELTDVLNNPEWLVGLVRGRHAMHPVKWAICWAWLWESEPAASAVAAFRRAVQGSYEPSQVVQFELWSGDEDASTWLAIGRVYEAMKSVQTLAELARQMCISGGVLRSWMAQYAALRSGWADRTQQLRTARTVSALSTAVNSRPWTCRAQFFRRYSSLVKFLRDRDAERLEKILAQIPVNRSKQRQLF